MSYSLINSQPNIQSHGCRNKIVVRESRDLLICGEHRRMHAADNATAFSNTFRNWNALSLTTLTWWTSAQRSAWCLLCCFDCLLCLFLKNAFYFHWGGATCNGGDCHPHRAITAPTAAGQSFTFGWKPTDEESGAAGGSVTQQTELGGRRWRTRTWAPAAAQRQLSPEQSCFSTSSWCETT